MSYKILTPKTEKILNLLIGEEFKAMQAYEAIANWCQNNGFLRAYDFFLDESKDEKGHAALLEKYILDMGCIPELEKIDAPVQDFDSLYDVIDFAMKMEMDLGNKYSEPAVKLATEDFLTVTKIQEFIAFQIESIGFYGDICSVKKDLSKDKFQQLMLEKILVKQAG
jgi:ferritin